MGYFADYLAGGYDSIYPFEQYMNLKGQYYCEWCKRKIEAINIKEAAETNCDFVFVHDSEEHPCDAIFKNA